MMNFLIHHLVDSVCRQGEVEISVTVTMWNYSGKMESLEKLEMVESFRLEKNCMLYHPKRCLVLYR